MTSISQSFVLLKDIQYYINQLNFIKIIIKQSHLQSDILKKHNKQIQKIQKTLKIIKKQIKDFKLTDLQVNNIYHSTFTFIEYQIREILIQYRLSKTDLQIFIQKKHFFHNQNTVGISMNIQKNHYDDRFISQINLLQVFDIQYHKFSLNALAKKANQILSNFKYHKNINQQNASKNLFLKQIIKNYNLVPYHNFTHVFSTFAFFYQMSQSQNFKAWINQFQLYFCLIACLCHDFQHSKNPYLFINLDGYNTIFETKCKSQMAMNFGNISVLQKMHCSITFSILQKKDLKTPFSFLQQNQKKYAKKIITKCILATDMSKHYDYMAILQQKNIEPNNEQDRLIFMQSFIHACDIGNSMLNYDNYITWANLVCVQFHNQTIQEQNSGLEPTQHLKFDSLNYFYKNQNTFVNSIVLPLWSILGQLLNENKIKQKCIIIKENGSKVSQHMRRNSTNPPKIDLSKYLLNLVKVK